MKLAIESEAREFRAGTEGYLCGPADDCSSMVQLLCWRAINQPEQKAYSFLLDGEYDEVFLTYRELDRKARNLAARLKGMNASGECALLLYPPGLDYIVALFACLYAGTIAVPAYPPRPNQHLLRLAAIIMDAQATLALTTASIASSIERHFDSAPALKELRWVVAENVPVNDSDGWQDPLTLGTAPAFLQYTSGSTGSPKGVIVTRDNLMHNSALIKQFFEHTSESRVVFWTPPYHDMGLIGGLLQPLYCGIPVTLISPFAFLQRPLRWLQAISRTRATTSGGPNFAYEMCVQKITPEQARSLDLSSWDLAFCGAEPVRAETLARFTAAFEPCGFRPEAFYPCYGLAEATLIVTGGRKYALPVTCFVQGSALAKNHVAVSNRQEEGAVTLVGCGQVASSQELIIVNPDNCIRCEPNEVGEIWTSGPSVAGGYWQQREATRQTFDAYLSDTGEGPFLRTGDLGFLRDGELFVVGRLKDLIIIDGLNHHPEDIEFTAERSHAALRPGCGAAFGIEVNGEEKLVIVYEVDRHYRSLNPKEVIACVRKRVAAEHQVQVHEVVLIKHGSILKTSSGKIQRHACRDAFLSGTLNSISDTASFPIKPGTTTTSLHAESAS